MAASTLQPHQGSCSSKNEGVLLNVHTPCNHSPPTHKQRSCNSSMREQFPFPQHPNSKDSHVKSSKHFVSAYSSFRARDNSSSDQIILSNRQTTDENIGTGRAAQRYLNVEDDELVKCNISISSFPSKKESTRQKEAGVAQESQKQSEQESLSSKADTSVSLSLILNQRQKAHEQKMYRWLFEEPKEKVPSLYTDFLNDAAKIISQDKERPNPKT